MSRLAFLGALAVYIATTSGDSYWLDSGEFSAVTLSLDIAHPPGHPLTAIWGKAFTFLPLGSLSFRVALGQGVAAALAVAFLCRALGVLGEAFGLAARVARPLALAGSWAVAFCFGVWFQAVRPEVYALQGMLLMLAAERLSALVERRFMDPRALYAACIAIGLGLTNHHLMAFFFFPPLLVAALVSAAHVQGFARRVRRIATSALFGAIPLAVYAYLPLRALHKPPANFGDPTTLERIYWVVSARAYAREMGSENPQPMTERFADVLVVLVQQLSAPLVLLGLLGAYIALRTRATRAHGLLWLLIGASVLLVRPWLGPVRGNPDSVGYLFAGLCAVAALASAGLMGGFAMWSQARQGGQLARVSALGLAFGVALLQIWTHGAASNLGTFVAVDAFDEFRVRQLPPRAVVIATTPQTVFRHLEAQASERIRPDTLLVPLPFLRYPGVSEALAQRAPEVRRLVQRYLRTDRLDAAALTELAGRRPVRLELDATHIAPSEYAMLAPGELLYRVTTQALTAPEWLGMAQGRERAYASLERVLGADVREVETANQLLWLRYMDAVHAAALGQRGLALHSLREGARLNAADTHLQELIAMLADPKGTGPVDVTPFLRMDRAP